MPTRASHLLPRLITRYLEKRVYARLPKHDELPLVGASRDGVLQPLRAEHITWGCRAGYAGWGVPGREIQ